jgi:protein-S-isoprenylcysteine O-methyltransferase Ste14
MTKHESSDKRGHLAGIGRHGEHPYGDLGQIIILVMFLAVWILDSFVFGFSIFLAPYVPLYIRLVVAGLILGAAIYLVRSGHRAVSDEILSSPRLLTDGAFSRVRHPIYLAALLFYLMLISSTLSLISLCIFVGIFVFYDHIATFEENFLEQKFGRDYHDYKMNTPKWIPRLSLFF